MPIQFVVEYTLWVFLSAAGVLQLAAARSGLHGLLFLRRWPRVDAALSALLVIGAFTWFFASDVRNVPDTASGLDGVTQALWFAVGAGLAAGLTLLVSSAVNHRWGADHGWDPTAERWPPSGLGWLERTTFLRAMAARISAIRGGGR